MKPEEFDLQAQRDQLWFGPNVADMSEEDRAALKALGWFEDEGSYSCFT